MRRLALPPEALRPGPLTGALVSLRATGDIAAREEALSYAAHRVLTHRYKPGRGGARSTLCFDAVMASLGYPLDGEAAPNSPRAIGDAFLYLCSPLADEVDGQVIQVDAGVGLPKLV